MKNSVLNLLLKLSSGWRPKKRNVDIICKTSSMILKQFKADGLYIACTIDIVRDLRYIQVLKIWDILPDLLDFQILENSLDKIFVDYNDHFKKCCSAKCLEGYASDFAFFNFMIIYFGIIMIEFLTWFIFF